jgi:hypothetical protein
MGEMSPFEQKLTRARMVTGLMESALHDGPWTFRFDDHILPAEVLVDDEGIELRARFPERREDGYVEVWCADEPKWAIWLRALPGEVDVTYRLDLTLAPV